MRKTDNYVDERDDASEAEMEEVYQITKGDAKYM